MPISISSEAEKQKQLLYLIGNNEINKSERHKVKGLAFPHNFICSLWTIPSNWDN